MVPGGGRPGSKKGEGLRAAQGPRRVGGTVPGIFLNLYSGGVCLGEAPLAEACVSEEVWARVPMTYVSVVPQHPY